MIVSHRHRFIFLKTRKTAGTSLEIALSRHCGPDDIITQIDPEDAQVRADMGFPGAQNDVLALHAYTPRDALGAIRHLRARRWYDHMPAAQARRVVGRKVWNSYFKFTVERDPFDRAISMYWFLHRDRDPRPDLAEFLAGATARRVLPNWPVYAIGNDIAVDYIARFEDLDAEVERLSRRLGLPLEMPPTKVKGGFRSDRRPYSDVLSHMDRRRIEQLCWREIAALGYEWRDGQR